MGEPLHEPISALSSTLSIASCISEDSVFSDCSLDLAPPSEPMRRRQRTRRSRRKVSAAVVEALAAAGGSAGSGAPEDEASVGLRLSRAERGRSGRRHRRDTVRP